MGQHGQILVIQDKNKKSWVSKNSPEASRERNTACAEAGPVRREGLGWGGFRRGGGGAFHTAVGVLRTSSLPGELPEAVYTEAVAALSLDGLPQDQETLLTFVLILHGHRQDTEGDPWQGDGAVQRDAGHSSPSICCSTL